MTDLATLDKQYLAAVRKVEAAKKRGDTRAQAASEALAAMLNRMILSARIAQARRG